MKKYLNLKQTGKKQGAVNMLINMQISRLLTIKAGRSSKTNA